MSFDQVLTEILALSGDRIQVTVAAKDRYPDVALAASGTVLLGTEVTGSASGSTFERFYFPFEDDPASGFFLDRNSFERANRWGDELRIDIGGLVMSIRQADEDALA